MFAIGVGRLDQGLERDTNEDNLLIDNDLGLYIVCDGMGGHAAGEVAANLAVRATTRNIGGQRPALERLRSDADTESTAVDLVREAVEAANAEVHRIATTRPGHAGMGCTLTLLLVLGRRAVMAHVGDTRLYMYRNGTVGLLSTDHTMAGEMVRAGVLEPSEVHGHPNEHVLTRAIGAQAAVAVETLAFDVLPGDRYLLCSDGLSRYLRDSTGLTPFLSADFGGIPDQLVDFANSAGGEDNIGVIAVSLESEDRERPPASALEVEIQDQLDALSTNFLFEGLSLAQALRLLTICQVESFQAEDVVVSAGEELSSLYIVMEGTLTATCDGQPRGELSAGDCFGATMLWETRPYRATVTAISSAKLLSIGQGDFGDLARQRPWLGIAVLERLGRRTARALERTREQLVLGSDGVTPAAFPELL